MFYLDTNVIIDATVKKTAFQILPQFIAPYNIIPFTQKEASAYGQIREQLSKDGTIIGSNDMLIAATALANGATLVTHNTGEFARVKGLHFEDWRQ